MAYFVHEVKFIKDLLGYFYKNQNIKAIELNRNALDLLLNQHYLHKDRKYYSEIANEHCPTCGVGNPKDIAFSEKN